MSCYNCQVAPRIIFKAARSNKRQSRRRYQLDRDHEQSLLQLIGKEGCYLLCVKRIAELELRCGFLDPVWVYTESVKRGWTQADCLLLDSAAILSWLTCQQWRKSKQGADYKLDPYARGWEVLCYARKTGSSLITHFVVGDRAGGILYNPLVDSITIAQGYLESKRIFTLKETIV